MEEIEDDVEFKNLMKQAQTKGQNTLSNMLEEIDNSLGQIPEDGTAAVDLEDAVSELIDWLEENK